MASAYAKNPVFVANVGLVVASLLAGASVVATRVAVQSVPPLSLAVLRYAQGGLILGLTLALATVGGSRGSGRARTCGRGVRKRDPGRRVDSARRAVWSSLRRAGEAPLRALCRADRDHLRHAHRHARAAAGRARRGTPGRRTLDGHTLLLVLFLGILGGAVVWRLFRFALSRLSPTQAAVYVNLNPLAAMALATFLLGERVSVPAIVGFAMVLGGVALVNWPQRVLAEPAAG